MTQRMGSSGQEIPFETQFMVVEARDGSNIAGNGEEGAAVYTVFLPILEGDFRAVLQGNENNELEICLESGKKLELRKINLQKIKKWNTKNVNGIKWIQKQKQKQKHSREH